MPDQKTDDLSDDIDKLRERKEYYEQWLEGIRKAQKVVPVVSQNLEITDWQLRALKNRPEEANEIPYPRDPGLLEQENNYIRHIFPPIQIPDIQVSLTGTA
jgi:hypothetical protein